MKVDASVTCSNSAERAHGWRTKCLVLQVEALNLRRLHFKTLPNRETYTASALLFGRPASAHRGTCARVGKEGLARWPGSSVERTSSFRLTAANRIVPLDQQSLQPFSSSAKCIALHSFPISVSTGGTYLPGRERNKFFSRPRVCDSGTTFYLVSCTISFLTVPATSRRNPIDHRLVHFSSSKSHLQSVRNAKCPPRKRNGRGAEGLARLSRRILGLRFGVPGQEVKPQLNDRKGNRFPRLYPPTPPCSNHRESFYPSLRSFLSYSTHLYQTLALSIFVAKLKSLCRVFIAYRTSRPLHTSATKPRLLNPTRRHA